MTEHGSDGSEGEIPAAGAQGPRPLQPMIRPTAPMSHRPSKPVVNPAPVPLPHVAPAIEPSIVDYSRKPARPATNLAILRVRQTMIPPTLVLGIGFISFGAIYFAQPPGSALGQVASNYAIAGIAFGALCLAVTIVTMFSVRKEIQKTKSP